MPARNTGYPRDIIHLDMDAFYPSVEVLDNPGLRGKPVIVGGSPRRGVVCSASYEARNHGVFSSLPMAAARRLCPRGIFLPVRMSRYRAVSGLIFEIFRRFTPLVEPLSIDEAFLDVTASRRVWGPPEELARKIKRAVQSETGLTVSAGVAPTKLVAKIASDLKKPDGLTVVPHEKVHRFLEPLPIEKLWGVGAATQKALSLLNIKTIGDLSRAPVHILEKKFGKHGLQMYRLSRGLDERTVEPEQETKSVSNEETFNEDILDPEMITRRLLALATKVARRLRKGGLAGRTVTLKVKYNDFVQVTRSTTLSKAVDDGGVIYRTCCRLLDKTECGKRPVRLLGAGVAQLEGGGRFGQLSLLDQAAVSPRQQRLNQALDSISDKFGEGKVIPGSLLSKAPPA